MFLPVWISWYRPLLAQFQTFKFFRENSVFRLSRFAISPEFLYQSCWFFIANTGLLIYTFSLNIKKSDRNLRPWECSNAKNAKPEKKFAFHAPNCVVWLVKTQNALQINALFYITYIIVVTIYETAMGIRWWRALNFLPDHDL